jgi:hypothetical protein
MLPKSRLIFLRPTRLRCFTCALLTFLRREFLGSLLAAFSTKLNRCWIFPVQKTILSQHA